MPYKDIEDYLMPGFPVDTSSDTQNGFNYEYIGPDEKIRPFIPTINAEWVHPGVRGTYFVTSRTFTPKVDNSNYSRLEITSVSPQAGGSDRVGINLDSKKEGQSRYQVRWNPQTLPLTQHPYFRSLSSGDTTTFYRDIQGWENELSESNRANYRYYPRDSDGNALSALVTIASGAAAYRYVTLRLLGHENYVLFTPSLQKVSQYRGTKPPPNTDLGQKIAGTPPEENDKNFTKPDWFGNWEWVKTDDSAVTVGNSSVWERTETWTGAKKVDYDIDQIFVGGTPTTPPTP